MTAESDALRSAVLALPAAARAQLAGELLDSLDHRPIEFDHAQLDLIWATEAARRAQQIDSGDVATDSWDDVLTKVDRAHRPR